MDLENRCLEVSKRLIVRKKGKRKVNTFKEFNKPLQMEIEFTNFSPTPEELSYHRFLLQHPCLQNIGECHGLGGITLGT